MLTDPRYFHSAGYWVERGQGLDMGFGGGATFYSVWAALMTDWPFAKETVERAYRLRAHLCLPEPDGTVDGPSHFNRRLGSPTSADQWHWDGARDQAAAMVTDEAACLAKRPTPEQLSGAAANRVDWFNFQIKQNPVRPDLLGGKSALRTGYWANEDLRGTTWTWRLWQTYNFPIGINPGYQFYRPGAYAHLAQLLAEDSPWLKLPFQRGETFLRNFERDFIVTRQKSYGAILHSGPVGQSDASDGLVQYPGPLGFGGGQLSAFWTPETGSVILGRRIGMTSETNFDTLDSWRQWPIHAVSGRSQDGKVFSSARIVRPQLHWEPADGQGAVTVTGEIPAEMFEQGSTLAGRIEYRRKFELEPDGVRVETTIQGDGKDAISELYETLPIFLRDTKRQAAAVPTEIRFQIGGRWEPATADFRDNVTAILLRRFEGTVQIVLDEPRRVKLSPAEWNDTYLTRAACRNVLIDLLSADGKSGGARRNGKVGYRIEPANKP